MSQSCKMFAANHNGYNLLRTHNMREIDTSSVSSDPKDHNRYFSPILQMKKLRLCEFKKLTCSHVARIGQISDSNSGASSNHMPATISPLSLLPSTATQINKSGT